MKKTKTEYQKVKSMHAKITPKNSPAMKGGALSKERKNKAAE